MARAKIVEYYNNRYKGSLSDEQCDSLEEIIDYDSRNGFYKNLAHIITNMNDSDVTQLIEDHDICGRSLHDYDKGVGTLRYEQTTGVAFMFNAGNCILGDSVGMGKTVEIAGLCNLLKLKYNEIDRDFKYMVLTGKNLTSQFRKEMIKFTGEYVELVSNGECATVERYTESIDNYGVRHSVVGSHSLITAPAFLGKMEQLHRAKQFPFDLLVIDESSILGNSTTGVTKSFKILKKYFKRIIFLNATPFETKLGIFYTQLSLLDDKLLPTKENFNKEYVVMDYRGMYPKPTGKYKNQGSFKSLVAYRYFARTREDKGAIMEDCNGGVLVSPLSDIQKEWLRKTQMNRLVYDCPTYLDSSIDFCIENVPKLGSLSELLKGDYAEADTILIFCYYKEAQKYLSQWLSNKGYSNRVLNGATDNTERASIIDSFKRAEFNVLITNVQKGLNFGNCNHCVFYSYDPNPANMIQFEGRITRDFDIIGKNIYILCSEGQEYKTLTRAIRDRAQATSEFTKTDLSVVMNILLGE